MTAFDQAGKQVAIRNIDGLYVGLKVTEKLNVRFYLTATFSGEGIQLEKKDADVTPVNAKLNNDNTGSYLNLQLEPGAVMIISGQ